MRWREAVTPTPMSRVALVAPGPALRDALVRVADAGVMEIDRPGTPGSDPPPGAAAQRLQRLHREGPVPARLAPVEPDLDELARAGRADLLAGEAELEALAAEAVGHGEVAALVGWVPRPELPRLAGRLAGVGAAAVPLPVPRGVEPPTVTRPGPTHQAFAPLVRTYATVPYADIDPTVLAGLAYVVMFGAMFGDAGHGALLLAGAALVRLGRVPRLAALRPHWLFIAAAGGASAVFGLAYGEFFGPTGVVPTLWLAPLEQPVPLLLAGVGLGAVLLAGAYVLGTVNRVREGGWAVALYSPSGLAGSLMFIAAGLAALAWYAGYGWAGVAAGALAVTGVVLAYIGFLGGSRGGPGAVVQAAVELFDMVLRVGTNVVSFARLAAFGLTHAVLGAIVWESTAGLWRRGAWLLVAAVLVFVAGNALSFALEALVAGVQALRLEYYELFSRVFQLEGRPFRPWHVPTAGPHPPEEPEEKTCLSG
ncbi:MAG TPA: V-type ATPase 116kDa subunit family protein [Micromonosporaceae bacterium]|nr:V-type ATPase 116kDa subunit family protein [Micromonosporaceae bacterium]